jgi:hypothetical protein
MDDTSRAGLEKCSNSAESLGRRSRVIPFKHIQACTPCHANSMVKGAID